VLSLTAGRAAAQEATDAAAPGSQTEAALEAARALGREALSLYDRGDYAAALMRFEQAYAVYPAPTLGLHAARCLLRLGRLASAANAYRQVTGRPPDADETPAFREARALAERELRDLQPRVPRLIVRVEGPAPGEGATLSIDGRLQESLSVELFVDPGVHRVEARLGTQVVRSEAKVGEGQREQVLLRMRPQGAARAPSEPSAPRGGSPLRTAGVVALGTGAAGLAVWGVAGAAAIAQRSDLDDAGCSDVTCPPALQEDVDAYNTARVVSAVGFVTGAVGVTLGITLLLAAPSEARSTAVAAWVGPASGGLRGRF
jgi:hypothetical protein